MIFVDTSFWLALRMPRDQHHEPAVEILENVGDTPLVTSNHVRGETWTFLVRRAWHEAGVSFLDALARTARLRVLFVSQELEREALGWLRLHDEREYSFVDATSFALMRSLGIREAFAFDGDFEAAGFIEFRRE